MSAVKKVSSTEHDFESITAMLTVQGMIIIAVKQPQNIFKRLFTSCYSFYIYQLESKPLKELSLGNYKNVSDMTNVESNKFAFIDQGNWTYSDICLVKIVLGKKGKLHLNKSSFRTDKNCYGITFTDSHYFLAYCGYVKMVNLRGIEKTTFRTDSQDENIFSGKLSKISVASDFKMHVSDTGKNQLLIVKVSHIDRTASIEAEYDNMAANSIIRKGKNELFIAIGGQKNEVVLLSTEGPKKIVRDYDITGTPTALCLLGEVLYVATTDGWLTKSTHIFGFTDKENTKKEERLLSI